MAWTKVEPTVTSFTQTVGPDTFVLTFTNVSGSKRAQLTKNGGGLGQYIDFPDFAFAKQLFEEVAPLL